MLKREWTKTEIYSELDLFAKYIKSIILEGMIEEIKKDGLSLTKVNEIFIMLEGMGMKSEKIELEKAINNDSMLFLEGVGGGER